MPCPAAQACHRRGRYHCSTPACPSQRCWTPRRASGGRCAPAGTPATSRTTRWNTRSSTTWWKVWQRRSVSLLKIVGQKNHHQNHQIRKVHSQLSKKQEWTERWRRDHALGQQQGLTRCRVAALESLLRPSIVGSNSIYDHSGGPVGCHTGPHLTDTNEQSWTT